MSYQSVKRKKKIILDNFINSLKKNYKQKGFAHELDFKETCNFLAHELEAFPEDAEKLIDSAVRNGELEKRTFIILGKSVIEELNKKEDNVEKEIDEIINMEGD